MANLGKEDTISIGHPAMCARQDIILPGYKKTNVITLGITFQPSFLTKIQIRLVLGYLKLMMPEEKRRDTNWWDDIEDSREMNYGSEFRNKSSSLNQGEDEGWLMDSVTIPRDFQKDGFP